MAYIIGLFCKGFCFKCFEFAHHNPVVVRNVTVRSQARCGTGGGRHANPGGFGRCVLRRCFCLLCVRAWFPNVLYCDFFFSFCFFHCL